MEGSKKLQDPKLGRMANLRASITWLPPPASLYSHADCNTLFTLKALSVFRVPRSPLHSPSTSRVLQSLSVLPGPVAEPSNLSRFRSRFCSGGVCRVSVVVDMANFRVPAVLVLLVVVATVSAAPAAINDDGWTEFIENATIHDQQVEQASLMGLYDGVEVTAAAPKGWTIVVDQSGRGNFKKVQQAINSIPSGNKKRVIIIIRPGVYREKIVIIKQKPFITFQCVNTKAILTWGDTAEKAGGTAKSASTAVESAGFIATDCTFANSAPAPPGGAVGKQAVALRIQGDQAAFYRCQFLGAQDTLYDKEGRHYFRGCHIVGSIDYIFGDGQSFYDRCKITSIAKGTSGSITAQKRETASKTGFVFWMCNIGGSGSIYLGRAWGAYSRTIFIRCYMANMIRPVGWQDWSDPKRQKTVFYAEYMCNGPGASRAGREKWSKVLTTSQAKAFETTNFIDGKLWLP